MCNLTPNQYEIIERAYKAYSQYISIPSNKALVRNIEREINNFTDQLRSWNNNESIDFIIDFALSPTATKFADAGQGNSYAKKFKKFLNMMETREKLVNMVQGKFSIGDNIQLHSSAARDNIRKYLDDNEFLFDKPKLLTGRLTLMIYTELYTTIAYDKDLDDTCEKLGINKKNSYLSKQRQIRNKIDFYLERNKLIDSLSELEKASIAWGILYPNAWVI